jgi:hypothetical protein
MSSNTQLTTASGYDTKRMVFSDPVKGSIPNSDPPINYQRINISTLNEDGTTGDLILPTSELFSFGVSENKDPTTQKVNGHVLPLCLWGRDGASEEEQDWTDTFNNIVDRCVEYLLKNREELEQYELVKSDLRKFNPLYWKKEKGKILKDRGPTLYAKLISSKKQGKILSMFFDNDDNSVNPLDLLGKYCFAKAAVKIESIFIGSKISLQVKLYEATVRVMDTGMKRLMRPKASGRLMSAKSNPMAETKANDSDGDDDSDNVSDAGSIEDDSDEEPPKPVKKSPVKKKKVVRKVRKVKKATA